MKHRTFTTSLAAVLCAGSCIAVQQPLQGPARQSVVDAAKQKSSATKAKRIYTNDDLAPQPELAPSPVEPGSEQHEQLAQPAASPAYGQRGEGKAETVHISQAEKVVEARKIQIDTMTEEKDRLEQRLHQPGVSADEYSAISESIHSIDKKIQDWKKQLDDAQKVIDDTKRRRSQATLKHNRFLRFVLLVKEKAALLGG